VLDDTSRIIQNEEGKRTLSYLGFTYAYDRRNSVVDPTAGFILTLNQQFAGIGGDTSYSKTQGTARAYTSFFDEDLVLSAELEGGILVGEDTRITDRFTAGGDSFRGFARNGLGPRDFCGDSGEPLCTPPQEEETVNDALGGNYYTVFRVDASFPIGIPEEYGVYGGVFGDIGSLWGLDDVDGSMGTVDDGFHVRSSVGVSLFVDTPFAPLRFNYAVPLQYEDYDELERFRFAVETRF
jgi:outer membrane protein insertion porin family